MKRTILLSTAVAMLGGGLAMAQSFNDQVIDTLSGQGFQVTEIKTGPTQTKVEAVKGTTKLEVVYDRETGRIMKQETERFSGGTPSDEVEFDESGSDFAGSEKNSNGDGSGDSSGPGNGGQDDDQDDGSSGQGNGDQDDDQDGDSSGQGNGGDDDQGDDSSGEGNDGHDDDQDDHTDDHDDDHDDHGDDHDDDHDDEHDDDDRDDD